MANAAVGDGRRNYRSGNSTSPTHIIVTASATPLGSGEHYIGPPKPVTYEIPSNSRIRATDIRTPEQFTGTANGNLFMPVLSIRHAGRIQRRKRE